MFQGYTGKIYGDTTGHLVAPSISSNEYILVVYDQDTNTVHALAFSTRLTTHIIKAYENILHTLTLNGISPKLLTMDNEISTVLVDFITVSPLDVQLVPPHLRQRNSAERSIRTFKTHFI